jgi:hypothetical protein
LEGGWVKGFRQGIPKGKGGEGPRMVEGREGMKDWKRVRVGLAMDTEIMLE